MVSVTQTPILLPASPEDFLFPEIKPFEENYLQVSELHALWYAQYGNPQGVPIVMVHGGPGFGCGPADMRYFDPDYYRIILFEQRGAIRSRPYGEIQDNTTHDLVSDLEKLRQALGVTQWLVCGGSWGSALSLVYGETHPDSCLGFILRGVFLGRQHEYEQVWYGMGDIFPEAYEEMVNFLPLEERNDLIASYYKRVMDPDPQVHMPAARAFLKYDMIAAVLKCPDEFLEKILANDVAVLGPMRIFAHYCMNKCFFQENQILRDLPKIHHLPAIIVHGRYDIICRAKSAYELHQNWPGSELTFVSDAGHASREPGITKVLVEAGEKMKQVLAKPSLTRAQNL